MAASNPETQTDTSIATASATTTRKPRSWWGTLLSFSVHAAIIALLWSAPSLPINIPEVPPPQSIDATILPPPPVEEEKPVEKPAEPTPMPPTTATPTPPSSAPQKAPSANNQPAPAPAGSPKGDTATPTEDNGIKAASGEIDGKNNSKGNSKGDGNGVQTKKLPAGAPVAIGPAGSFHVDYDVSVEGSNNKHAEGGGTYDFQRQGEGYNAILNAQAKTGPFKATIKASSKGSLSHNAVATEAFHEVIDFPFSNNDKESSFTVDYTTNKVAFNYKDKLNTEDLTQDVLFDYISAIAYLQAGLQQGKFRAGQGDIPSIPIGKRLKIDKAKIYIGNYERQSTGDFAGDSIPVSIVLEGGSSSLKSLQIWFMPDKEHKPLKMVIGINNYVVTFLSKKPK